MMNSWPWVGYIINSTGFGKSRRLVENPHNYLILILNHSINNIMKTDKRRNYPKALILFVITGKGVPCVSLKAFFCPD